MKRVCSLILSAIVLCTAAFAGTVSAETSVPAGMLLGDVDASGALDSSDARAVLQCTVGKSELSDVARFFADGNADGTIDSVDARLILQMSVGKAECRPCTVVDATAGGKVEVLYSRCGRSSDLPIGNERITDAAGWKTYCAIAENDALAEDRYDDAFFAEHDLLVLSLSNVPCVPDGLRIGRVYDNGAYCLPELLYNGGSRFGYRMVLAVTLDKGDVASAPHAPVWTLAPTAEEGQPVLTYCEMMKLDGTASDDLYRMAQVTTRAELDAQIAAYAKESGAAFYPAFEELLAVYDDAYFAQNALVLLPQVSSAIHYEFKALAEQEDGTLKLCVRALYAGDGVGSILGKCDVLALQVSKTDLAGRAVNGFEVVETVDIYQ